MSEGPATDSVRRWLTYRPEIKVLDCTIRDGGLMNDHRFSDDEVRAVYQACVEAGIDYLEFGYKGSRERFSPDDYGPWKFCAEEDLRRIVGDNDTDLKISVMADAEKCAYRTDILPAEESVIDLVRVACYIHQIPTALDMIADATEKGYETSVNLMAVSAVQEKEIEEALELLSESLVGAFYVVDSFGSLYSEQVRDLVRMYLAHGEKNGKQVGMHAHNNQQLAFANTIEAITMAANFVDGSLAGLGRGAGNCPTENLLGFLHNPKYHMRPLIACIQHHIEPMRERLKWGPDISYLITGQMNQHPRTAMKHNAGPDRENVLVFWDQMHEED